MKPPYILLLVAAVAFVAGCSSTHHHGTTPPASTSAPAPAAFNTSALVAAFKNADNPSNLIVQSVVSALSAKDYSGALGSLQKLAAIPGLTAAQSDAVQGLISSVSSRTK